MTFSYVCRLYKIIYFQFQCRKSMWNNKWRKAATCVNANKLSLDISKTKYSWFHSTRKGKDMPNILPPLQIDSEIKREVVTKFLGVYLDENISWKDHINIVSTEACKSTGILYKTCYKLNKFLRKQLFFPL